MAYDIIGDIHGQADKLEALLARLGYRLQRGAWRHPGRSAVFVGDLIDRGPHQLRTVELVSRMTQEGAALTVLGNHELNAVAWHTPDPDVEGEYLRPRAIQPQGDKNRKQHARFLAEVEDQPERHARIIEWFRDFPLWLDLPGIRVVHACWHGPYMKALAPLLTEDNTLPAALLPLATRRTTSWGGDERIFRAVETLTKGLEAALPDGHSFRDEDGFERREVRLRWWDPAAMSFRAAALVPEAMREALPEEPLPPALQLKVPADKPIFFGHYWLRGTPQVLGDCVACVDYSAGAHGPLVAYRWDGEARLDNLRFVSSD